MTFWTLDLEHGKSAWDAQIRVHPADLARSKIGPGGAPGALAAPKSNPKRCATKSYGAKVPMPSPESRYSATQMPKSNILKILGLETRKIGLGRPNPDPPGGSRQIANRTRRSSLRLPGAKKWPRTMRNKKLRCKRAGAESLKCTSGHPNDKK